MTDLFHRPRATRPVIKVVIFPREKPYFPEKTAHLSGTHRVLRISDTKHYPVFYSKQDVHAGAQLFLFFILPRS